MNWERSIVLSGVLLSVLLSVLLPALANAAASSGLALQNAHYALYEGNTRVAASLLATRQQNPSAARSQLQISLWIAEEETDQASELLLSLQQQHPQDPALFYFAGHAWQDLARQAGFFSTRKYYQRSVAAYIRAAELAPQNPQYLLAQARAYGQPSLMGGDAAKQAPLVQKIQTLDPQYGLLAALDLAQNQQDTAQMQRLAGQAASRHPGNFLLLERAAQAYRTLENEKQAQQLFARACQLPPQPGRDRESWIFSCFITAYISDNSTGDHALAVTALSRLLSISQYPSPDNEQRRLMLAEMAEKAGDSQLAKAQYQRLADTAENRKIRKQAKKALSKLKN